jgi:hypothetical protein
MPKTTTIVIDNATGLAIGDLCQIGIGPLMRVLEIDVQDDGSAMVVTEYVDVKELSEVGHDG